MFFLKIKEPENGLAMVQVIYSDIPANERFKKPDMPVVETIPDAPENPATPYYDMAAKEVIWVELPVAEGEATE